MRLYLADAMSIVGAPTYNFPAFERNARTLRAKGHDVVSPNEIDEFEGWVEVVRTTGGEIIEVRPTPKYTYEGILARDLEFVSTCDGIVMGPDWKHSPGAKRERAHAEKLGLVVFESIADVPNIGMLPGRPAHLVGLTGYAQSGKDTSAGFMAEHGFQRLAFADALKNLAVLAGPEFADRTDYIRPLADIVEQYGWEYAKASVGGVREFLQDLGVGVRDIIGSETWVNVVLRQLQPGGLYVITDVRFPNEVQAIRRAGGTIARVQRPGTGAVNAHVSEAFDGSEADWTIRNDGDLDQLRDRVDEFVGAVFLGVA